MLSVVMIYSIRYFREFLLHSLLLQDYEMMLLHSWFYYIRQITVNRDDNGSMVQIYFDKNNLEKVIPN